MSSKSVSGTTEVWMSFRFMDHLRRYSDHRSILTEVRVCDICTKWMAKKSLCNSFLGKFTDLLLTVEGIDRQTARLLTRIRGAIVQF